MTFDRLSQELKYRYAKAGHGSKVLALHLLGISFAGELARHPPEDIAESATGKRN